MANTDRNGGNIDYRYDFLGINSINTDYGPGMAGGGDISDEDKDSNLKNGPSLIQPKSFSTFDKNNVLVRHGGILDSLFTPAATKKKNEAGFKDILQKIDD